MTGVTDPRPAGYSAEAIEPWLTRDDRKRAHYRDDPYFWEGRASFLAACSGRPGRTPEAALRRLTFLLVKPEAIARRRVAPILRFLDARGYRVAGTWPVRMGRHEARALWRYQLNAVPIAHIRALEMVVTAGELFLLGLDQPAGGAEVSAAEMLSRCKGSSADPAGGDSLRDRLGRPSLMLNFVHAPDDPADVLRELAVLCDAGGQEEIIAALLAAGDWPVGRLRVAARAAEQVMTAQYALVAAHDLDAAATVRRVRASLRDSPAIGLPPAARAAIEHGTVSAGRALEVVGCLESCPELAAWDRVVLAAHLVDRLRTGRDPLIGPPPAAAWARPVAD